MPNRRRAQSLAAAAGICLTLAACGGGKPTAQGLAAQAVANCENGYDRQNHITDNVPPECQTNGAMGSSSTPAPAITPWPSPSATAPPSAAPG